MNCPLCFKQVFYARSRELPKGNYICNIEFNHKRVIHFMLSNEEIEQMNVGSIYVHENIDKEGK